MTTTPPAGLAPLIALNNWVNRDEKKIPYIPSLEGDKECAKAGEPATWRSCAWPAPPWMPGASRVSASSSTRATATSAPTSTSAATKIRAEIDPAVRAAIMLCNTYSEPSPSGTGIHIIGKGTVPPELLTGGRLGKNRGGREIYGGAHYFTMTFRPFPGFDRVRAVDADTMRRLAFLMWPDEYVHRSEQPAVESQQRPAPAPIHLDDADLLAKAFEAKGGEDFRRRHEGVLILGNTSDDDWAYFGSLRFWAQADPARMRRMALASRRVRDKWFTKRGGADWLDYNIAHIIEEDQAKPVYDPVGQPGHGTSIALEATWSAAPSASRTGTRPGRPRPHDHPPRGRRGTPDRARGRAGDGECRAGGGDRRTRTRPPASARSTWWKRPSAPTARARS